MGNGANIKKTFYYLKKNGIKNTFYAVCERMMQSSSDTYCFAPISYEERTAQKQKNFEERILFSIIVPMYETREDFAKAMITSVLNQTYGDFELILADASRSDSVKKTVSSFLDERIVYIRLESNDGISENTNQALKRARGEFVGLLDHDDLLSEDALYEMALAIEQQRKNNRKTAFLYSDEDKCDTEGIHFYDPNIKTEFNYDLLLSNNYICHFLVMKTALMKKLTFRKEFDGAQDYDIVLRAYHEKEDNDSIVHINRVLYHWRCHESSTAANPQSKLYAYEAGKRAVEDFLITEGITGAKVKHTKHNGFYRVEYGKEPNDSSSFFDKRKDAGILAGPIISKNKITGGIYNNDGNCPYAGLNCHFSGYLHRAVLQQDSEIVDIRNMAIRPELREEYTIELNKLIDKYSETTKKISNDDLININRAISEQIKQKGYRLVWDPQFQGSSMGPTMKSTVVIPNYNGSDYLYQCLLSLDTCNPKDFSIIVVDNGSTDNSIQMMKEKFPLIRFIEMKENAGFAAAVNAGIKAADTPYVILLNNDTTVNTDFVKQLEDAIERDDKIFSVSAKMIQMAEPDKLDGAGDLYCALGWAFALGKGKNAYTYYKRRSRIFSACAGAAIYRRDAFEKIGFFDENHFAYLEDTDIGYRAAIYGYHNEYAPAAVCLHAGSASSGSRYNPFKITLSSRNSIYLIYKNMPLLQIFLNLPFLLAGFLIKIFFFIKKGYGAVYCKGLVTGFKLSCSAAGREQKVTFQASHFLNYCRLQLALWVNIIRRICG